MKTQSILLLASLLLLSSISFAQQNAIKGKLGYLPISGFFFAGFSISYERFVSKEISIQLTSSGAAYDFSKITKRIVNNAAFVLEVRKYFKPKDLSQSFFIAPFIRRNIGYDNYSLPEPSENFYRSEYREFGAGLLLGKNCKIGKNTCIEVFAGPQLKFRRNDFQTDLEERSFERSFRYKIPRIGFNLAYYF